MLRAAARRWSDRDVGWAIAQRRPDIPEAVTALAAGRTRVELGHDEAGAALAWAERVNGWPATGPAPLFVHPRDPRYA